MEYLGQTVSSNLNDFINFRSAENNTDISHKINYKPVILQKNSIEEEIIEQKIFSEGGMPFILLTTNLCERPIKLFIHTGAAVSIIANDVIKNENIIVNHYTLNLIAINGNYDSITTQGMVNSKFSISNTILKTKLHIVDRKYAGPGDGYLGFDFLAPYKVNIDLNKMFLIINSKKIMKSNQNGNNKLNNGPEKGQLNEEIDRNFLNILSQSYDFEPEKPKKLMKNSESKKILEKFDENDPIKDEIIYEFNQKERQKIIKDKLNTCPVITVQYQNSLDRNYIPQEKNESYIHSEYTLPSTPSTLMNKQYKFETPQVIKIGENLESNTSSVNYFKDYG